MKQFIRKKLDLLLIIFFLLLVGSIYAYISLASHNHFQTFGWDLGYFDQIIWLISRGIFPFSTLSGVNLIAGHFSPILLAFAPLYWIWADPRILLIVQSFLVVYAALPLYLIAKMKTTNLFFPISVVLSYLFFIGTQWTILNEFHEMAVVPISLSFLFYSLEKNRRLLFWVTLLILFLTKEEMSLLIAAIGLMVWLYFKKSHVGLGLFLFGIVFFFFLTNFFMPLVSEKGEYYQSHLSNMAKTPSDFFLKIITDPLFTLKSLINPAEKGKTFLESFLAFGLLPVFAPYPVMIPLAEQFLTRFLYTGPQFTFWQNVNHHAAPSAILLALSSIYGMKRLQSKFGKYKRSILWICSLALLFSTIIQDVLLKGPIHSIFKKQLYETLSWMKDNYDVINKVQKSVDLAAQNNLVPHLSQRRKIYLLPEIDNAEEIVVDLHNGPNKYSPMTYEEMRDLVQELLTSKRYSIVYQKGDAMLLQRNYKTDITKSK